MTRTEGEQIQEEARDEERILAEKIEELSRVANGDALVFLIGLHETSKDLGRMLRIARKVPSSGARQLLVSPSCIHEDFSGCGNRRLTKADARAIVCASPNENSRTMPMLDLLSRAMRGDLPVTFVGSVV